MVSGRGRILAALTAAVLLVQFESAPAATYRSENFQVTAASASLAQRVALTAEEFRRELAVRWLGHAMPRWAAPCRVMVRSGQLAAGGATTFSFQSGEVFGWRMTLQGSESEVLESILPHELTHTILACRFRRPLPRWADEGAATLAESTAERRRQHELVRQLLRSGRRIRLARLLGMREYPSDRVEILSLYAQGASLVAFLVEQGGRARFLVFLEDAERNGWRTAVLEHYGRPSIALLERDWAAWASRSSMSRTVGWRASRVRRRSSSVVVDDTVRHSAATVRAQSPSIPAGRPGSRRRSIWRAPDPRRSAR
ncbi:MAG: hypothetical protein VB859_05965 [Planctomycetaceae bacterium]